MRVYAIRHGQTIWNERGLIQGRTDTELNDMGRLQARAVCDKLPACFDHIYSSPLKRAWETAEIIADAFGFDRHRIKKDNRLVERNFGIFDGLTLEAANVASLRRWHDFAPTPGGETLRDVAVRVNGFLDELTLRHRDGTVLIVTHGHVIRTIYWYFNGLPEPGNELAIATENCAVYEFDAGLPRL